MKTLLSVIFFVLLFVITCHSHGWRSRNRRQRLRNLFRGRGRLDRFYGRHGRDDSYEYDDSDYDSGADSHDHPHFERRNGFDFDASDYRRRKFRRRFGHNSDDSDDDDYHRRRNLGSRRRGFSRRERSESLRSEKIFSETSAPKIYGDSCISKPRYIKRRQDDRTLPVRVKDLHRVLEHCEEIFPYAVDTNTKRIRGGGRGGCVYMWDITVDHWSVDPNAYLNRPFYTKQQRRDHRYDKVRDYGCARNNRGLLKLQARLAADKEYCRQLRLYTVRPYCNACEYKAIISDGTGVKKCTRQKLEDINSPGPVIAYMQECIRDGGKKQRRC